MNAIHSDRLYDMAAAEVADHKRLLKGLASNEKMERKYCERELAFWTAVKELAAKTKSKKPR